MFSVRTILLLTVAMQCPGIHPPALLLAQQPVIQEETQVPLSLQKPKLQVSIQFEDSVINPDLQKSLPKQVLEILQLTRGTCSQLEVTTSPDDLTDSIPAPTDVAALGNCQIRFLVGLNDGVWTVDSSTRIELEDSWQQGERETVRETELLARKIALQATLASSALLLINSVDDSSLSATLLAGEYGISDSSLPLLDAGDLMAVVMLYYDRNGNLMQRQKLPYTYLQVESRDRSQVVCQLASAFRSPIPRSRRRVEVVALRLESKYSQTQVHVEKRGHSLRDAELTRVYVSPWHVEKKPEEASFVPSATLYTDRTGHLQLETTKLQEVLGTKFVKLEVMSENVVVARVPYFLGSQPGLSLQVPDDSARVAARIQFEQVKTELLRVTAKRAVLVAALKKLIEEPREIPAEPFFEQIAALPARQDFQEQTNLIRIVAETELMTLGNRVAARQVKDMQSEVDTLINRFLDDEQVVELKVALNYVDPVAEIPASTSIPQPGTTSEPLPRNPRPKVVIPQFK
ncbi:MAG: hypothetical protein KDA78_00955 [Planctomycetaceae bacterium]|nr:hypothetical protein [Planctomycetaceae bacterium]